MTAAGAGSNRAVAQGAVRVSGFFADRNRRRAADCRLQPEPQGRPEIVCALAEARRQDVLWARPQTKCLGAARWFTLQHVRQVHAVDSQGGPNSQGRIDAGMTPKAPLGTCPRWQKERVKLKHGRVALPTSVEAFRLRSPQARLPPAKGGARFGEGVLQSRTPTGHSLVPRTPSTLPQTALHNFPRSVGSRKDEQRASQC